MSLRPLWIGLGVATFAGGVGVSLGVHRLGQIPIVPSVPSEPVVAAPRPIPVGFAPRVLPPVALARVPAPAALPAPASDEPRLRAARSKVEAALGAELERLRPQWVALCFPASGSAAVSLTYQFVIDAEGNEVGRGVQEARDASAEVAQCIRAHAPPTMHIAPPGQSFTVDVFVSYP